VNPVVVEPAERLRIAQQNHVIASVLEPQVKKKKIPKAQKLICPKLHE
jgi:hypothetical protein